MYAGRRLLVTLGLSLAVMFGGGESQGAGGPGKRRAKTPATATATKSGTKASKGAKASPAKKTKTKRTAARGAVGGRARAKGKRRARVELHRESHAAPLLAPTDREIACPADMVAVAGRVCVDRWETSLLDDATGATWSPFYTPDLGRARTTYDFYAALVAREARADVGIALPEPPAFAIRARAVSVAGVLPQGYLSADQAEGACRAAGKRLCTESEWVTACEGEDPREFPYGERYEQGTCNVFRETHPSLVLHGNAARYHDDPRNHLVEVAGRRLLETTGASPRCASRWGDDAVMDMVGNLDEWVADDAGVFVGGFYSRGTRSGCRARVSAHVRAYSDYSTGARCCKDPGG